MEGWQDPWSPWRVTTTYVSGPRKAAFAGVARFSWVNVTANSLSCRAGARWRCVLQSELNPLCAAQSPRLSAVHSPAGFVHETSPSFVLEAAPHIFGSGSSQRSARCRCWLRAVATRGSPSAPPAPLRPLRVLLTAANKLRTHFFGRTQTTSPVSSLE